MAIQIDKETLKVKITTQNCTIILSLPHTDWPDEEIRKWAIQEAIAIYGVI